MPRGPNEVADCIDAQDDCHLVSLSNEGRSLWVMKKMDPTLAFNTVACLGDSVKVR